MCDIVDNVMRLMVLLPSTYDLYLTSADECAGFLRSLALVDWAVYIIGNLMWKGLSGMHLVDGVSVLWLLVWGFFVAYIPFVYAEVGGILIRGVWLMAWLWRVDGAV